MVVVVVCLFFRFRLHDAGSFPRGAEIRLYKNYRRFFASTLHCGEHLFIARSGFSFGDFQLALFQNKKKSGRGRDKFSTVYLLLKEKCQNYDLVSPRCSLNQL